MKKNSNKKRIIFFSTPALGHIMPEFTLIKSLVDKGYLVDWYCSNKYKDYILKSGANFIEYGIDFDNEYNVAKLTENFYNLLEGLTHINQQVYKLYVNNNYDDVILIIYDTMSGFAKNIAKKKNIKSVSLSAFFAVNPFVFTFSHLFFSSIKLYIKNIKGFGKLIKEEKRFRKGQGLPKFSLMDMFVNKGDLNIVYLPYEFQPFAFTFPKDVKFVGTNVKDRQKLKEEKYNEDYDIYVSFGSVFTENPDAMNQIMNDSYFDNKKVIINIGDAKLKSKKENIKLIRYTNQTEMLKHCKFFINQGGFNSVCESIYNMVPQISIPIQQEQLMNAKIMSKRKVGYYLKEWDLDKVKKCISKIENDKNLTENLKKTCEILKKYDGTRLALNYVMEFINNK